MKTSRASRGAAGSTLPAAVVDCTEVRMTMKMTMKRMTAACSAVVIRADKPRDCGSAEYLRSKAPANTLGRAIYGSAVSAPLRRARTAANASRPATSRPSIVGMSALPSSSLTTADGT